MALCNSLDTFQEKMRDLFADIESVWTYIDNPLILTRGSWKSHLTQLEIVLKILYQAGLKVNTKKSFFGKHELEYLGCWISRTGIQPVKRNITAIMKIAFLTKKTDKKVYRNDKFLS